PCQGPETTINSTPAAFLRSPPRPRGPGRRHPAGVAAAMAAAQVPSLLRQPEPALPAGRLARPRTLHRPGEPGGFGAPPRPWPASDWPIGRCHHTPSLTTGASNDEVS